MLFKRLLSVERAQEILLDNVTEIQQEEQIPTHNALHRVAATDIYATMDLPPFDRATMDGFAVRSLDIVGASETKPVRLRLVGHIKAGKFPRTILIGGMATRVDTGSVIPKGADAVVPIEYCEEDNGYVLVYRSVGFGENIQWAGSDIMRGELLIQKGTLLSSRHIGALVGCGINHISAKRRPKVAVFSIGDELVTVGKELEFGQIYDINIHTISSLVKMCYAEPVVLGTARDNVDSIISMIAHGLKVADIVVSTGGSSVGQFDFIRRAIETLESKLLFHGVMSKPGKPVLAAKINNKLYIGLPGNPTSAIISFLLYVKPIIFKLCGCRLDSRDIHTTQIYRPEYGVKGRRLYKTVVLKRSKDKLLYEPLSPSSESISTLSKASGFFVIPENVEKLDAGEIVNVNVFEPPQYADLIVVGEFSPTLLRIIADTANMHSMRVTYIRRDTIGTIASLKTGAADIGILNEKYGECLEFSREIVLIRKSKKPKNLASKYSIEMNNVVVNKVGTHQSAIYRLIAGYTDSIIVPREIANLYNLEGYPHEKFGEEKIYVLIAQDLRHRDAFKNELEKISTF